MRKDQDGRNNCYEDFSIIHKTNKEMVQYYSVPQCK